MTRTNRPLNELHQQREQINRRIRIAAAAELAADLLQAHREEHNFDGQTADGGSYTPPSEATIRFSPLDAGESPEFIPFAGLHFDGQPADINIEGEYQAWPSFNDWAASLTDDPSEVPGDLARQTFTLPLGSPALHDPDLQRLLTIEPGTPIADLEDDGSISKIRRVASVDDLTDDTTDGFAHVELVFDDGMVMSPGKRPLEIIWTDDRTFEAGHRPGVAPYGRYRILPTDPDTDTDGGGEVDDPNAPWNDPNWGDLDHETRQDLLHMWRRNQPANTDIDTGAGRPVSELRMWLAEQCGVAPYTIDGARFAANLNSGQPVHVAAELDPGRHPTPIGDTVRFYPHDHPQLFEHVTAAVDWDNPDDVYDDRGEWFLLTRQDAPVCRHCGLTCFHDDTDNVTKHTEHEGESCGSAADGHVATPITFTDDGSPTPTDPTSDGPSEGASEPVFVPRSDKARKTAITAVATTTGCSRPQARSMLDAADPTADDLPSVVARAYSTTVETADTRRAAAQLLQLLAEAELGEPLPVRADHDIVVQTPAGGTLVAHPHSTEAGRPDHLNGWTTVTITGPDGTHTELGTGLPARCGDPLRIAKQLLKTLQATDS